MLVVGKELRPPTATSVGGVCIRYRAFDKVEKTCLHMDLSGGTASAPNTRATLCYNEAKVGEPLPQSCR